MEKTTEQPVSETDITQWVRAEGYSRLREESVTKTSMLLTQVDALRALSNRFEALHHHLIERKAARSSAVLRVEPKDFDLVGFTVDSACRDELDMMGNILAGRAADDPGEPEETGVKR